MPVLWILWDIVLKIPQWIASYLSLKTMTFWRKFLQAFCTKTLDFTLGKYTKKPHLRHEGKNSSSESQPPQFSGDKNPEGFQGGKNHGKFPVVFVKNTTKRSVYKIFQTHPQFFSKNCWEKKTTIPKKWSKVEIRKMTRSPGNSAFKGPFWDDFSKDVEGGRVTSQTKRSKIQKHIIMGT